MSCSRDGRTTSLPNLAGVLSASAGSSLAASCPRHPRVFSLLNTENCPLVIPASILLRSRIVYRYTLSPVKSLWRKNAGRRARAASFPRRMICGWPRPCDPGGPPERRRAGAMRRLPSILSERPPVSGVSTSLPRIGNRAGPSALRSGLTLRSRFGRSERRAFADPWTFANGRRLRERYRAGLQLKENTR
jgi:hypothetical protein